MSWLPIMSAPAEDFEDVENLSPSEEILNADPAKPEKGKLCDRAALSSLLNVEVKGNEPFGSTAEKLQPELKEPAARDAAREILQDVITNLPVDSYVIENRSATPALEEQSSGATLGSSSDNTWKSCGEETPSQKFLHSLNSNSSNFETAADLSNYSLPSSKEVSFTLPLDDLNNTFDAGTGYFVSREEDPFRSVELTVSVGDQPLESVDVNVSAHRQAFLQNPESCCPSDTITVALDVSEALISQGVPSLDNSLAAVEECPKPVFVACPVKTLEVDNEVIELLETFSNLNFAENLENEIPIAVSSSNEQSQESELQEVKSEVPLQGIHPLFVTTTKNCLDSLTDVSEAQELLHKEVVLSVSLNDAKTLVDVVENCFESKPSPCSGLLKLASSLEAKEPVEDVVNADFKSNKLESQNLPSEPSIETQHPHPSLPQSYVLHPVDTCHTSPDSKDCFKPALPSVISVEPCSTVPDLLSETRTSSFTELTVIGEAPSDCALDKLPDTELVSEFVSVEQSVISSDVISSCDENHLALGIYYPETISGEQSELVSQNQEPSLEIPQYLRLDNLELCEVKHNIIYPDDLVLEQKLCNENLPDDWILDSSLLDTQGTCPSTPVKSLLDSSFNVDDIKTPVSNSVANPTSDTDIQAFVTSEVPAASEETCSAWSTKVLDVPNHYLSPILEQPDTPKQVPPVDCFNPSKEPIAKEPLSKDFIETELLNSSIEGVHISDTEETDSLSVNNQNPVLNNSNLLKQIAMPTPNMDPHESNQWNPNSLNSDDNRAVDVNVNPCPPSHAKDNESPLKNVGNHLNSESVDGNSVTSSPNKRKNEEDSAFEDFVPMEDANSDLVDDHLMEDQVEDIGVAAVSRRSPSRNRVPELATSQPVIKQNQEAANRNATLNNESEAGPEVAEFTEEEFRCATEVFKDPSTFEFLQRAGNTRALEDSALSRLSLYVKFDPLVNQKSPELRRSSTFKKPAPPQKKSAPSEEAGVGELISLNTNESPPVSRRESDINKLIDFHSPSPPLQVVKSAPKMVPVEPLQRIEDNLDCKKLFSEEDMKKALQINELLFQERLIKKEKELSDMEQSHATQLAAILAQKANLQEAANFTRNVLEESGKLIRKWQEKKELERVESTRERDQALEDLQNVEASFSELHRRYEKIKNVLEGYKQNEEGLRVQLQDCQGKLRNQEQMYEALKGLTHEKLETANSEIENAKKAGGSEMAILRSQLMKAEMKISSLEKSLDQKGQEYAQLSDIYDDLIARVSEPK